MEDAAVRADVEALEALLASVEELADGEPRSTALAAIQGLLRLYGEALRRIAAHASSDRELVETLEGDELVSQLLLLHGVHPATLEERIAAALDEVRPYMGSHGGGIELVSVAGGIARVRLQGTCSGCAASTVTLKLAVQDAVLRAAPELHAVEAIESEAPPHQPAAPAPTGSLLPMFAPPGADMAPGRWFAVGELGRAGGGAVWRLEVAGQPLVFASSDGELYAYVDSCPACRRRLEQPRPDTHVLRCEGCGRRYDIRRAGVGVDGGLLQLDPVPLLVQDGQVRVALEAGLA